MLFCVKYCVNGQEYLDNNNSTNFQIDFRKKAKPQNGEKGIRGAALRPANPLPRSNKRPPEVSQRPKSIPVAFDDFGEGFDAKYHFDDFKQLVTDYLGQSGTSLRFKGAKSALNLGSDDLTRRTGYLNNQSYWDNDIKVLRPNPSKAINEEDSDIDNCSEISGASDSSSVPSIANMRDARTSFSKDSGYVSMVSKTQRATPNNGEGAHDSARWESESVASVQSLATMDTNSSVNPAMVRGAAEELAETLVKDDSICCLIIEGYKNFESDRFERNFRRMLKKFALSLRKEAQNDLERSTVHLVYNYRAYVISLLRKRLTLLEDELATTMDELPKQKASQLTLERYLEQFPGAEGVGSGNAGEENDSASDNDSDFSNDEQPSLPNLEKVKLYLLSSTAYSELK